jgi:hypothetical protein
MGSMGIAKQNNRLIIDLNQDGVINLGDDLVIHDFFTSDGLIEAVANLNSIAILNFFSDNQSPTNINLSNPNINENEPIGTEVGTFTSTDPDTGDTFTYSLVAGEEDTHNSLFTIDGDILKTSAVFDFESQETYSIRVQTTDSANNIYSESFTINVNDVDEPIDLVNQSFDVISDHILGGNVTFDFTIANQVLGNAGSFNLQFVYSDDDIIGNDDDLIVDTLTIDELLSGDNYTDTHTLQLPLSSLNTRAINDDPPNQGNGYLSNSYDYLGIIIDPENQITESDELNNFNSGQGIDKDDVTYFPWDIDSNGVVTSTDAIFVINRIGQTMTQENSLADLNGDGVISSTDAISIINRVGYQINSNVMEDEITNTILPATIEI